MTARYAKRVFPLLFAMSLAGCTSADNPTSPPPGSPPSFQSGYRDGCSSGFHDVGRFGYEYNEHRRLDAQRYASDSDYHGGWDRGYMTCREYDLRAPFRDTLS